MNKSKFIFVFLSTFFTTKIYKCIAGVLSIENRFAFRKSITKLTPVNSLKLARLITNSAYYSFFS